MGGRPEGRGHKDLEANQDELNSEIFRVLFLAGKTPEEQAFIIEKIDELTY